VNLAPKGRADESTKTDTDELLQEFNRQTRDCAIILLDAGGDIRSWNKGAEHLFGYREAEILGRNSSCLYTPDTLAEDEAKKTLATATAKGHADQEGWRIRQDGSRVFTGGAITLLWDHGVRGFVMVARDLTAKTQETEELEILLERERAARAAAESAAHMKDEFLGSIAHELRTPLTAILLWARILRGKQIGAKDQQEAVETIERSANAQSALIEDLLDVSRMMSGKLRLNVRDMAPAPVVEAAVQAARLLAKFKDITITVEVGSPLGKIRGDPVRLQQIVWNLLTNAVRFSSKGGVVKVIANREDGHIHLKVEDSGSGILPDDLAKLFDHPWHIDGKSAASGGLGLAVCRRLVELHGGTLRAESAGLGRGATFTVTIPVFGSTDGSDGAAHSAAADTIASYAPSKLLEGVRILLVDDEPDTRNVMRWLLEQSGADVSAAGSASEARAALERDEQNGKGNPDILLSDIGMPGEDGNELLRQIREMELRQKAAKPMPAIAITGYSGDENRRQAYEAGYQAFVPKPIEGDELVVIIADLVGRNVKR